MIMALTVLLSILLALTAGIGISYFAVSAVLRTFALAPRKAQPAFTPAEFSSGAD